MKFSDAEKKNFSVYAINVPLVFILQLQRDKTNGNTHITKMKNNRMPCTIYMKRDE